MEIYRGKKGQKIIFGNEESERNWLMRKHLIRGSRKISRLNLRKAPNPQAREHVKKAIRDLETHQPVGLLQILSLSRAIRKRIRVHHPGENVDFTIGKRSRERPLDLEYHDGHWTLKNEEEPEILQVAAKDCLFEAVACLVEGYTPGRLRHQTIKEMKFSESRIAKELEELMYLEKWEDALQIMLGGARYFGRSASDAGRVIDNSQNGTCHPRGMSGHPRGHASYPYGSGSTDSVENYSRSGWKTGFLSRNDQDLVGHQAFTTDSAQEAMDRLNNGEENEAVHISSRELRYDDLPLACEFRNGQRSGSPQRIQQVTAVFRHHSGMSTFHSKKNPIRKKLNKGRKIVSKNKKARLQKVLQKKVAKFGKEEVALAKIRAREIIKDFEEDGSIAFLLVHLSFLSKAIKRNLKITSADGNLEFLIDPNRPKGQSVYLEYHKSGHWTQGKKNHHCDFPRLNNCLFKVVGSQVNKSPAEIRYLTIKEMKINENHIARKIADIEMLELLNPFESATSGVKYDGTSLKDAQKVLDNSQKGICDPQNVYGHPRGHASHPSAEGRTDSVENYSRNSRKPKTAFLSRSDQDYVANLALDSDRAQEAIERLNEGSINEEAEISVSELDDDNLPMANEYRNGLPVGDPQVFRSVKAILRHPSKKHENVHLHVQSLYPIL